MFIVFFLGIIGLLHYVLFRHLAAAWPAGSWVFGGILLVLLFLPFLMAVCRRRGFPTAARFFALTGFTWLGLLFVVDCVLGLTGLANLALPFLGLYPLTPQTTMTVAAVVSALAIAYGTVEARTPRLNSVKLPVEGIPRSLDPVRIVQISDLHLGYVANADRLRALVQRINDLKPDLICSTGDLFDSEFEKMGTVTRILSGLKARLGKFAISGNHEVYENLEAGHELTRQAGFQVLRGGSVEVAPGLWVAGVDDAEGLPKGTAREHEALALRAIPEGAITILLKHRPTVDRNSADRFTLQLSGHTHGGQIFPFNLLTRLVYRYGPGLTRISQRSSLYLSRGTGTWGPQFRIFAPPEITLIELRPNGYNQYFDTHKQNVL